MLRLRRIAGQVKGLERMAGEPALCVDLLTQVAAVQAALKGVGDQILHHHVHDCIQESFGRRLSFSQKARLLETEQMFAQYCKQPRENGALKAARRAR
jgi:CsoR family transcriptional regulator, copper-sensing transcriptional repressor